MAGSVPVLTVLRHPIFFLLFVTGQKPLVHARDAFHLEATLYGQSKDTAPVRARLKRCRR
jgi:hypothetical protein